jgi:hypothetical protein
MKNNELTVKHTPTPWKILPGGADRIHAGKNAECHKIVSCYTENEYAEKHDQSFSAEDFANAAFIVRACNNFDDMLEALKLAEPIARTLMDELAHTKATDWGLVNDGLIKICRAIACAEGKPVIYEHDPRD